MDPPDARAQRIFRKQEDRDQQSKDDSHGHETGSLVVVRARRCDNQIECPCGSVVRRYFQIPQIPHSRADHIDRVASAWTPIATPCAIESLLSVRPDTSIARLSVVDANRELLTRSSSIPDARDDGKRRDEVSARPAGFDDNPHDIADWTDRLTRDNARPEGVKSDYDAGAEKKAEEKGKERGSDDTGRRHGRILPAPTRRTRFRRRTLVGMEQDHRNIDATSVNADPRGGLGRTRADDSQSGLSAAIGWIRNARLAGR